MLEPGRPAVKNDCSCTLQINGDCRVELLLLPRCLWAWLQGCGSVSVMRFHLPHLVSLGGGDVILHRLCLYFLPASLKPPPTTVFWPATERCNALWDVFEWGITFLHPLTVLFSLFLFLFVCYESRPCDV